MKRFPYIFSLSTVGLIHHYNNDYIFNRFRTDFTGDSGSGKSMIADLLQLVFVGSAVFVAATDTIKDKREPQGMVLNDKKRGYGGKGYALLNIAVSEDEYLVMGMYLEGSTRYTRPFIVMQGIDLEEPVFLKKPLLFRDFLDQNAILPIEELKLHLKSKGFNCEPMQMPSYHRFLFKHKIVPFDLENNPEKLKTYALIIRSFSRGKGFKFDTDNLQDFLFGKEREEEIVKNYENGIRNIKNSLEDSLQYHEQLNLLKEKRDKLKSLINLEKELKESHINYLNTCYKYWKYKEIKSRKTLADSLPILTNLVIEIALLDQLDNQQQIDDLTMDIKDVELASEGEGLNKKLTANEIAARERFLSADAARKQVNLVKTLLPKFSDSINQLKEQFNLQKINQEEKRDLDDFQAKLTTHNLTSEFKKSDWSKDYGQAKQAYELESSELEKSILSAEALLKFSNVSDLQSTAYWAINRPKAFTKEEESVLVKLQDLIVSFPKDRDKKYLPEPDILFSSIYKKTEDNEGFWVELSGIQEYVPYVAKQFLDNNEPDKKREFFTEKHASARQELAWLRESKTNKDNFYKKLTGITGLEDYIALYQRQKQINEFGSLKELNITEADFQEVLSNYVQAEKVEEEYNIANKEWESARDLLAESTAKIEKIKGIKDVPKHLESLKYKLNVVTNKKTSFQKKLQKLVTHFKVDTLTLERINETVDSDVASSSLTEASKSRSVREVSIRMERKTAKTDLSQSRIELLTVDLEYGTNSYQRPEAEGFTETSPTLYESLRRKFETNITAYTSNFEAFVNAYLEQDRHKFDNETDWRKLAIATLPEVFKNTDITEEQFSTEIEERLAKIIEQNSIIGDRKIHTLIGIFEQVENTFSRFSEEVGKLRNFFSGNDKRVTGGYKVVLKLDPSKDYPIAWIAEFKKQIRNETISRTGLFKIVDDSIDFKEIIQKVFRECGGKKQNPSINDLLNPKKYFELSFKLEKENVSNSGSTGQVYSAIALLCIARISLIEKDEENKDNKGIRFMPIDEAEGLGSNYQMLSKIAKSEDYQIVSMSINPVGEFEEGSHYIYMLNEPEDEEIRINGDPFAQFTEEGITENVQKYIYERVDT